MTSPADHFRRRTVLLSLIPQDAVFLYKDGCYWRPHHRGYTAAADPVNAGLYDVEEAMTVEHHSSMVMARNNLAGLRMNGPAALTLALDEIARLREKLGTP